MTKMYTEASVSKVVHARLDQETQRLLEGLRRRTGLSESELVRQGLRALASVTSPPGRRMPIGTGLFESGVPDLGSNDEHLKGFGAS